jgi:8-oxo-dGTP pyrophosphatase MutT (NUDIX family)
VTAPDNELPGQPPHVAASAFLVTNESGLTLLVANPYREGLVLPGGVVESGESPAAAAEREALEESAWRFQPVGCSPCSTSFWVRGTSPASCSCSRHSE